MTDPAVVDALGVDLRSAGYSVDGVAAILPDDVNAALGRGVWWPALALTRGVDAAVAPLATIIRLFILGSEEPEELVAQSFPSLTAQALIGAGVLERVSGGLLRASLDIRPHGDDQR